MFRCVGKDWQFFQLSERGRRHTPAATAMDPQSGQPHRLGTVCRDPSTSARTGASPSSRPSPQTLNCDYHSSPSPNRSPRIKPKEPMTMGEIADTMRAAPHELAQADARLYRGLAEELGDGTTAAHPPT